MIFVYICGLKCHDMEELMFKVAAAVPQVNVADCEFNTNSIVDVSETLDMQGVELVVFPELSITGCTCGDLFCSEVLVEHSQEAIAVLVEKSKAWNLTLVVGTIIEYNHQLYNCGVMISHGHIVAVVPSRQSMVKGDFALADAEETSIKINGHRVPFMCDKVVRYGDFAAWIVVGDGDVTNVPNDANIIIHLGAHSAVMGESRWYIDSAVHNSAKFGVAYIYSSAGYGESTTDYVYDGNAVVSEDGQLLACNELWQRGAQMVVAEVRAKYHNLVGRKNIIPKRIATEVNPFIPYGEMSDECYSDAVNIQVMGLMRRMEVTRSKSVVIGISGGLDSTLALLVAVKTFDRMGLDRKGIIGVTMPGFGTTDRTYNNALIMMRSLGITMREISIVSAVKQHFGDIGHDETVHDVTYENSQARERTQILMDIANQVGGMVLGTGDMSELALGWATYNGDHMSMYGINAGVPKTLVRQLVQWIANSEADEQCRQALLDVIDTPISPELTPADNEGNIKQKTEDLVGPYELHDFFMYYVLRYGFSPRHIYNLAIKAFGESYDGVTIKHWLTTFFRRFFTQQFKRSCMPDGPCVCGYSLSPRGGWHMPSDASPTLWLNACNEL